jgi:hypothetical protein
MLGGVRALLLAPIALECFTTANARTTVTAGYFSEWEQRPKNR